jgi:hypothetical protein
MKSLLVAIFVVLCSIPAPADADDAKMERYLSAAFILDACKEKPREPVFRWGSCAGQIQMLYLLAAADRLAPHSRFCMPDAVTIDQARKVVIKYIDERPEQLHKLFMVLAIEALRKAWPCPN